MTNIVERLRNLAASDMLNEGAVWAGDLLREAGAEIERLRELPSGKRPVENHLRDITMTPKDIRA